MTNKTVVDILGYIAQPYSYNPKESYLLSLFYRNTFVKRGIFTYSPINETHKAHQLIDEDNMEMLYNFYMMEDLRKIEQFARGVDFKHPFALFMGYGWNLTINLETKKRNLVDLIREFKSSSHDKILSQGAIDEYVQAIRLNIPCYELGAIIISNQLIPAQIDSVYYSKELSKILTNYLESAKI